MGKEQRTPAQIIGADALTQLIFEGYEVVPARRSSDEQAEVVGYVTEDAVKLMREAKPGSGWRYHMFAKDRTDPTASVALYASRPAVAAGGVTEAVEQLVVREARRVEILNWLQEEIGTGWTCDNCGYCTYHSNANECADCGAPFPLEHLLAFKLHATATEDAELIAESRATFEASGILTAAIAVRDEGIREGWQDIATLTPADNMSVILAVPQRLNAGWIVGEAIWHVDAEDRGDWWWAGTGPGDYYADPISIANFNAPTHWRPLPEAPTTLPTPPSRGEGV